MMYGKKPPYHLISENHTHITVNTISNAANEMSTVFKLTNLLRFLYSLGVTNTGQIRDWTS